MAKLLVTKGQTSKLVQVNIKSAVTGGPLTGLAWNTSGLTAYYYREGAASSTAITLATMTLGTWATGGFVVVDGTNMPGVYQLSIPNAALASGANSVVVYLQGAANMAPCVLECQLITFNLDEAGATPASIWGFLTTEAVAGDSYAVLIRDIIDDNVTAIKAKTDNLPSDPADQSAVEAAITAATVVTATTLLKMDWTGITGEAAASVLNALRKLRNKWAVSADGLTLTVYKEDGTTTAYTQVITSVAGAAPVTGLS